MSSAAFSARNRIARAMVCPFCGNPLLQGRVPSECQLCQRKLAVLVEREDGVRCPTCHGILIWGAKFCHHCATLVPDDVNTKPQLPGAASATTAAGWVNLPAAVSANMLVPQPVSPSASGAQSASGRSAGPYTPGAGGGVSSMSMGVINPDLQREIRSIASLEQASAIAWLVIGILQVISVVTILLGIWNIYWATTRFRRRRDIEELQPDLPHTVDGELTWCIVFLIINFFFGAIIGIAGVVLDLIIRDRILKIRTAFENSL